MRIIDFFDNGVSTYPDNIAFVDHEGTFTYRDQKFEETEGHRTKFMDIYALLCRAHLVRFGTTQEQLAIIASKNHFHSTLNPKCHYDKPMSVEEILAARSVGYPLTVPMCSPLSDGSSAALLCTEKGLKKIGAGKRAVRLRSSVMTSATDRDWDDFTNHLVHKAALEAYEDAGAGPDDMDVAEFQINPSGGLESKGHPIGATGLGQAYELVTQLRGEAGGRQVDGAKVAIQENGGGLRGIEEGVAVVNVYSL